MGWVEIRSRRAPAVWLPLVGACAVAAVAALLGERWMAAHLEGLTALAASDPEAARRGAETMLRALLRVVAAFALSVPFDALAYPLSRGLYATHDTIRQVGASFAGFFVVIAVSTLIVGSVGVLAIPLGYAAGMVVKDALLVMFLLPRVRRIGVDLGGHPTGGGQLADATSA